MEILQRVRPASGERSMVVHRIPLGLILLSRQQLTAAQLNAALEAQKAAGRGRIGEWLQDLGFVTEPQVFAALARQWACPVLRTVTAIPDRVPSLPSRLLESFRMIPVDYVEARATLYVAFSERIDYTVLYAIEQILGCHTEPCLVQPKAWRSGLLDQVRKTSLGGQVVFDRVADAFELAKIVGNYASEILAEEIRMAFCGPYVWARLEPQQGQRLDLVLRAPGVPFSNPHLPPTQMLSPGL
jgi:hypothetical protein